MNQFPFMIKESEFTGIYYNLQVLSFIFQSFSNVYYSTFEKSIIVNPTAKVP